MTSDRQKRKPLSFFGFSSILLSFVMICIVIFSVLSYMTVNSNYRLSRKAAERSLEYHKAEQNAYIQLAEADKEISSLYNNFSTNSSISQAYEENDFIESLPEELNNCNFKKTEKISSTYYLSEPVSDSQNLYVEINVHFPQTEDEPFYNITNWSLESIVQ